MMSLLAAVAPLSAAARRLERDRAVAAVLIQLSAVATGAPAAAIAADTRSTARAALARQLAIYLANVGLDWSVDRISQAFGRARSTTAHACGRIEDLRDRPEIDRQVDALESWLRHGQTVLEGVKL